MPEYPLDPTRRKRRRMIRFRIGEISGVDRPAQAPALVTLIKRQQEHHPSQEEGHMPQSFLEAVDVIRKRDACSRMQAMQKARDEYADLLAQQQAAAPTVVKRSAPQPNADRVAFQRRAAEIKKRDNCSHMEAMQKAREEHPIEFRKLQAAN